MSDRNEDIRATAEDLIEDAEKLKQIERSKLRLDPEDRRLTKLADESNRIIARMAPKGEAQKDLASDGENT